MENVNNQVSDLFVAESVSEAKKAAHYLNVCPSSTAHVKFFINSHNKLIFKNAVFLSYFVSYLNDDKQSLFLRCLESYMTK